MRNLESEIDSLLLAQGSGYGVVLLWFEAFSFHLDSVRTGLQLRKVESARVIGTRASPQSSLLVRNRHRGTRHRRPACIAHLTDDRAGSFTLGEGCFRQEKMKQLDKNKYQKSCTQHGCKPSSVHPDRSHN